MVRMFFFLISICISTSSHAQTSVSEGFAGWCYFNEADSNALQVTLQGYGTTEGWCDFSNPTQIRGMDAMLFDKTCSGDGFELPSERSLLVTQGSPDDLTAALMSPGWTADLFACTAENTNFMTLEDNASIELDTSVAGITLIKNRYSVFDIANVVPEAIGMKPNFFDRFLAFGLGGCGSGCIVPFIVDTTNGELIEFPKTRREEQTGLQIFADPEGPHVSLIFLAYREEMVCVSQLFRFVAKELVLITESTFPDDQTYCGMF